MYMVILGAKDSADMAEKTNGLQCNMVTVGRMEEMWNEGGQVGGIFYLVGRSVAPPRARRIHSWGNNLCKGEAAEKGAPGRLWNSLDWGVKTSGDAEVWGTWAVSTVIG